MNTIKFGVPDSLLKNIIGDYDMPCTNEGEVMAMACGAWLAGKDPVVYMQNSGLANCVDIITSLYKPYDVPLPAMILGVRHRPEHHAFMGKITRELLKLLEYDRSDVIIIEERA